MFERFTDRARRIVVLAQEEARSRGHTSIGTGHLLLGLVADDDSTSLRVLTALGASAEGVDERFTELFPASGDPAAGHLPFAPEAKLALEMSLREALAMRHDYIGSGHILLGVLREGSGPGAQVLGALGVTLEEARRELRNAEEEVLEQHGAQARQAPHEFRTGDHLERMRTAAGERLTAIEDRLAAIEAALVRLEERLAAPGNGTAAGDGGAGT